MRNARDSGFRLCPPTLSPGCRGDPSPFLSSWGPARSSEAAEMSTDDSHAAPRPPLRHLSTFHWTRFDHVTISEPIAAAYPAGADWLRQWRWGGA